MPSSIEVGDGLRAIVLYGCDSAPKVKLLPTNENRFGAGGRVCTGDGEQRRRDTNCPW